jgi:hypothetical protein
LKHSKVLHLLLSWLKLTLQMKTLLLLLLVFIAAGAMAQPTITTDSVLQTGTCAGSSIIVRYKTTGSFAAGNRFTAQLSNAFGQFTTPVNIGTSIFNVGVILASIPANAQLGFLYRIRVVSSNPAIIGSNSPNTVFVTSTALTANIMTPDGTSVCPGQSITLSATLPIGSYQWSTGATTQSISVNQAGSYWVKVTDPLGCDARDTVEITSKPTCVVTSLPSVPGLNSTVTIYPNPVRAKENFTIKGLPTGYTTIELFDITGRKVASLPVSTSGTIRLGSVPLAPGIYQLLLTRKNSSFLNAGRIMIE